MGKRGPKPKHHLGEGSITRAGYHRLHRDGRLVMAHRWEWEQVNGPIPDGHQIHHVNGDKLDNRIGNLQCLTATEHKRIHSGCTLVDGRWFKPCPLCEQRKEITAEHWYLSREGWPQYNRCRPCHIRKVVKAKQDRRANLRALRAMDEAAEGG